MAGFDDALRTYCESKNIPVADVGLVPPEKLVSRGYEPVDIEDTGLAAACKNMGLVLGRKRGSRDAEPKAEAAPEVPPAAPTPEVPAPPAPVPAPTPIPEPASVPEPEPAAAAASAAKPSKPKSTPTE